MSKKKILINAFNMNCIGHINHGLWTHPRDNSTQFNTLEYWTELAQLLERGLFDGLIALIGTIQVALLYPQIAHGGVIREEFMWLPSLGLNFVLRMDGFAWLFSILVLGIGTLVSLYARYYMSPDDPVPRFFAFFLAFMGAMLGLVISGNLIQIVFFWELTSLFSFLLIGYWHHRSDARRGAYMALMVTGAGGLCLLAGVMLLGHVVGSYDLDAVLAAGDQIRAHSLYPILLPLILIGALSKSAQFPFHFWLPHAMAAPTPVSAYLHSATMVKAGVFLLARLWPSLSGTEEWFWIVSGAGACTLVLGAYCAMFQNDLKGLLAYSTISHLGLITLLLGLNSPLAAVAAVFHILNHATFKASLFMAAGIIDHESGTRDIRKLSGLFKLMPYTATLAMVASASMAGVPLLNGFLSKEMFFAETVFINSTAWVEIALPVIATIAITGIGNALPREVLQLVALSKKAAKGDAKARRLARELEAALAVLSSFDEGCDLVLYYKHLMVLNGDKEYTLHFNETDVLSDAQRNYAENQYTLFRQWYANWSAEQNVA